MNSFFSESSAFKFRLASQSQTEFFSSQALGAVIKSEQQIAASRNIYMTVLSLAYLLKANLDFNCKSLKCSVEDLHKEIESISQVF